MPIRLDGQVLEITVRRHEGLARVTNHFKHCKLDFTIFAKIKKSLIIRDFASHCSNLRPSQLCRSSLK